MNPIALVESDISRAHALLGQPVCVVTLPGGKNKREVYGNVYTIDPVTGDVILVTFDADKAPLKFVLLPGDSIASISPLESESGEIPAGSGQLPGGSEQLPAGAIPSIPGLAKWIDGLFVGRPQTVDKDDPENQKRKRMLCEWMRRNYLPVKEDFSDGSLVIQDAVRVQPPYTPDDCFCDNAVVLARIRNLIERAAEVKKAE